jgi:hypothetical protein
MSSLWLCIPFLSFLGLWVILWQLTLFTVLHSSSSQSWWFPPHKRNYSQGIPLKAG